MRMSPPLARVPRLALATLLLALPAAGRAGLVPRGRAAAGPATPKIQTASLAFGLGYTQVLAASARLGRLVVLARGPGGPLLSIVAVGPRLRELARNPLAVEPQLVALDARRGRAYTLSPGGLGSAGEFAAYDTGSGRRLGLATLTIPDLDRMAVDPASGMVVVVGADTDGPTAGILPATAYLLTPAGAVARRHTIPGTSSSYSTPPLFDAARHLLVLGMPDPDGGTVLQALDSATLAPRWGRRLAYNTRDNSGPGLLVAQDIGRGQIWVLAPGGLVTVIDAASGRTLSSFARRGPALPSGAFGASQGPFFVDQLHHIGYVAVGPHPLGTNPFGPSVPATIDRIDPAARDRHPLPASPSNCVDPIYVGEHFAGVGQRLGVLLMTGTPVVSLCDARTLAPRGAAFADLDPQTYRHMEADEDGGELLLAENADLPFQDPVTGATRTAGVAVAILR